MKDFIFSILKMVIVVFIIFLIPFMLPIILKIFLKIGLFLNIEEFKNIVAIFNNMYVLIYILLGIIILLWFFHKWENIKNLFNNMNFSISFGDKKITAEHMQQEMNDINSQKEFLENIKDENGNSNIVLKEEVKEKLGIGMSKEAKKCEKCNKENLERENSKLREFATYNVINTDAKSILHTIYNKNYIDSNIFKSRIIQGYKKRNRKNIKFNKKDIDKIAQNKYMTIFEGLIFLNIIEPSEDDKIIKLTKYGKQFVEKYIEKKEVV